MIPLVNTNSLFSNNEEKKKKHHHLYVLKACKNRLSEEQVSDMADNTKEKSGVCAVISKETLILYGNTTENANKKEYDNVSLAPFTKDRAMITDQKGWLTMVNTLKNQIVSSAKAGIVCHTTNSFTRAAVLLS